MAGSNKFQPLKFDGERIMKVEGETLQGVKPYEFGKLERPGEGNYTASKSKFGALAATDADRRIPARKDERFVMNPVLRERLAVDQEEKRAIEARIASELERQSQEAREVARAEGFAQGRTEGHEQAFTEFKAEAAERLAGLEKLVAEFEGARDEIFRSNERFLLDLIYRISRMVLLKELKTDREYLLRLSRSLIERSGVRDSVRIRIPLRERETIAMLKQELEAAFGDLKNLSIEASQQVESGCRLETRWNAIDATLETQFEGLQASLIGQEPEPVVSDPVADDPIKVES